MFTRAITPTAELRLYQHEHAQEVYEACCKNREHIRQWLTWVDGVKSLEDTRAFIRTSLEQLARDDGFQCGIWDAGKYAGGVGFIRINKLGNFTEIGYWLTQEAQGRGLMTAACRVMVDHAFAAWKLNKVEIRAAAGNQRSRAIPIRLGFKEEATLRQVNRLGDTYHDLVVYGMLASEWHALKK